MHDLVIKAELFATVVHGGQKRKWTGVPYIRHPNEVVFILRGCHDVQCPHTLAAAWLHDTVEDCGTTLVEIERYFGHRVEDYVSSLTCEAQLVGNRARRKRVYADKVCQSEDEVQLIKCADIISNAKTMHLGKKFALLWVDEQKYLLDSMTTCHPIRKAALLAIANCRENTAKEISNDK